MSDFVAEKIKKPHFLELFSKISLKCEKSLDKTLLLCYNIKAQLNVVT